MPTTKGPATTTADEVWGGSANPGPILVAGDFTIAAGHTVRILPGVEVRVQGAFKIEVLGGLVAGGLRRSRIVFRAESSARGAWTGIQWKRATNTEPSSRFEFCDVLDAVIGLDLNPSFSGGDVRCRVVQCRFSRCDSGMRWKNSAGVGAEAWSAVYKSIFENNRVGLDVKSYLSGISNTDLEASGFAGNTWRRNRIGIYVGGQGQTVTAAFNTGTRKTGNRVYDNEEGVVVELSGSFTAQEWWWGTDTGPTHSSVPGGTGDAVRVSAGVPTIDVTPWTERAVYIDRNDRVRERVGNILREAGTAAIESLETVLDDDVIEAAVLNAMGVVDGWYDDERLEKPLFARGTQTNEELDLGDWRTYKPFLEARRSESRIFRLRYRPVRTVTLVEVRSGTSTWTAVANDEYSGWWASEAMRRDGYLQIRASASNVRSAFRVTYDHGYDVIPKNIEDSTLLVAATSLLGTVTPPGVGDTFGARVDRLQAEIERREKLARGNRVDFAVG